jgi:hypothetical protein
MTDSLRDQNIYQASSGGSDYQSPTAPHYRPDTEIRYGEYRRDPGLPLSYSFIASPGINRSDSTFPRGLDLVEWNTQALLYTGLLPILTSTMRIATFDVNPPSPTVVPGR